MKALPKNTMMIFFSIDEETLTVGGDGGERKKWPWPGSFFFLVFFFLLVINQSLSSTSVSFYSTFFVVPLDDAFATARMYKFRILLP